jgi:hypothetical protein
MEAIMTGTQYDPYVKKHKETTGKYRHATESSEPTGKGWSIADKIFGYMDKAGNIYNEIRYPTVPSPGDANYQEYLDWQRTQNKMLFGLPSPFGAILLVGGIALVGIVIYKVATK